MATILRKTDEGWQHWCTACERLHTVPNGWEFNNNFDKPSFTPSIRIRGKQAIYVGGKWTGDYRRDPKTDEPLDYCCHYFITLGAISYQNDCTHGLRGRIVPLEPIPDGMSEA